VDHRADKQVTADPANAIVRSLALELDMPAEHVAHVYRAEAVKIEAEARIKTFVPIIIAGRVRAELRRQQLSS
jgi:Protein of unknown function (DUF3562).